MADEDVQAVHIHGASMVKTLTSSGLLRNTLTTTLNGTHTDKFKMNSLISQEYETMPIEGADGARMPGYTGHVPGAKFASVYGQRKAAATKHEHDLRPIINATGGTWQDMQMMPVQPEMRSYNKEYMYAENLPAKYGTQSQFLQFASDRQFDHRKM